MNRRNNSLDNNSDSSSGNILRNDSGISLNISSDKTLIQNQNPNRTDSISSLYIHVPFCTRKCGYCDYYSINSKLADFSAFYSGIKTELEKTLADIEQNKLNLTKLKTLYIGGGTPTVLPPDIMILIIEMIRKEIGFQSEFEFTLEVNPEPIGNETMLAAIDSGVNRISLGYQAKQNFLLKTIGRLHTYEDFVQTLALVRQSKIENISCDLMFGLPDQTLANALESAEQLIEFQVPHISFYSLILEQGTLFYRKYDKHPELLPSDDLERTMYRNLITLFKKNQYDYYELSSTAKTGFNSRHNYNYWTTKPYLGLGPSAHSYYNGVRKGNVRSINRWLADPWNTAELEPVSTFQAMQEYAMLAFRLAEGFSPRKSKQRFGVDHPFSAELERLLNQKLIFVEKKHLNLTGKPLGFNNQVLGDIQNSDNNLEDISYRLTTKGLDFANQVFIEFVG